VPIIRRNSCVYEALGTCYSVWLTVWYAGAYAAAYQTEYNTCYSVWMTGMQELMLLHTRQNTIHVILCGWLVFRSISCCIPDRIQYLLFCVDHCLVCRSISCCIPGRIQYLLFCVDDWYAGAYAAAYQTEYNTCYSVWMTGMQEHMLLHTRQNTILDILCGWLSGMQEHMLLLSGMQGGMWKCLINTVVSPDDGNIVARNM